MLLLVKLFLIKNKDKEHIFKDNSIILKGNESGSVFKVYAGINGDGYNFCKVQIKNERYPQIGDKLLLQAWTERNCWNGI